MSLHYTDEGDWDLACSSFLHHSIATESSLAMENKPNYAPLDRVGNQCIVYKPVYQKKITNLKNLTLFSSPTLSSNGGSIKMDMMSCTLNHEFVTIKSEFSPQKGFGIKTQRFEHGEGQKYMFTQNEKVYFVVVNVKKAFSKTWFDLVITREDPCKNDTKWFMKKLDYNLTDVNFLQYKVVANNYWMWMTYKCNGTWFMDLLKFRPFAENEIGTDIENILHRDVTSLLADLDHSLGVGVFNSISIQFHPSRTKCMLIMERKRDPMIELYGAHVIENDNTNRKFVAIYSIYDKRFSKTFEFSNDHCCYGYDVEHGNVVLTATNNGVVTLYKERNGEIEQHGDSFSVVHTNYGSSNYKIHFHGNGKVKVLFQTSKEILVVDPFAKKTTGLLTFPVLLLSQDSTVLFGGKDEVIVLDNFGHQYTLYVFRISEYNKDVPTLKSLAASFLRNEVPVNKLRRLNIIPEDLKKFLKL